MAIILFTKKYQSPEFALLNRYPDQFVTEKTKKSEDWWKINMDYWYNISVQQYSHNKRTIVPNYELVKGILRRSDFFSDESPNNEIRTFTETILKNQELPAFVKHYSILTPVINDLVGELSKRPDNAFVKAFDADSQSQELAHRTDILKQLIVSTIKQSAQQSAAQKGVDMGQQDPTQEQDEMTPEQAIEQLSSYTSMAEKWGARVLELMKMRFNLKEKSEDAFRDLLISGKQFFHIYEDTSQFGFNVEVLNPRHVWYLTRQDEKYISDPLDPNAGAYACGTVHIMEFSEIISKMGHLLSQDEIDHMRDLAQQGYLLTGRKSNLIAPVKAGWDSVQYDVYDPGVLQYRRLIESDMSDNKDELKDLLGLTSSAAVYGNKFLVVRAYWCSKKKVGKLTYIDEQGTLQTQLVDESYKSGMIPTQQSLEWGWVNQWYQGIKIGMDIYHVKPLEMLDYCPIIGALYEVKNVPRVPSLIDQMKPFQMLYNVAMNQLFRLLEKDMGRVMVMSLRHIPVPKDGDYQDAIEMWETEARERGVIFVDDSPENVRGTSTFNQFSAQDLSRTAEIQARYNLAVQMRSECWKLVGISEQRLGEMRATETATATNSALTQSYAQTEPLFAQHEYTLNKLYQALLDAALYIESHKPESTISYINSDGENCFVQINGSDLKFKELGVFVTSRAEDAQNFKEFRQLSQAMLQNGASPYEISVLYATKSMRKMQEIYKQLKDKQDQFAQAEQQQKQQELDQRQQQFEAQQQQMIDQHQKDQEFTAGENDLDRQSKERIAAMSHNKPVPTPEVDPFAQQHDANKLELERNKADRAHSLAQQKLLQDQQKMSQDHNNNLKDHAMRQKEAAMEKYKVDTQLKIARENNKSKEKQVKMKPKPKPAAKKK